jgi:polysaccharide biosynthesis protein PslG
VQGVLANRATVRWGRWLIRAVVLVTALGALNALPRRLVVMGPPHTVRTRNAKMGVHTRLTDEVEEWKIQESLAMVREMGAPWIVEYFPWGYYESSKGNIDWSRPDLIIRHARHQGLTVIARIDFVPEWARPPETTFRYLDREHFPDYADFVAAFAARYRGEVEHIVVWNEPNLAFEWGYRLPDPDVYAELLCLTYRKAKEANPEVQILAAGMAPTLAPPGSEWGMDDLVFLERLYEAGGGACFDGMAIHAYGLTFPPEEPPHPQEINFRRAELVHELMVRHGDGDKPCYITEGGWNDHPRWTKAVRPYQRIEYTIRAYEWAQREWDWCEAVAMWAFRYPWPHKSYQDHFTFVTPEFIPKPIYVEVRHYAHGEPYEYLESDPTDLW